MEVRSISDLDLAALWRKQATSLRRRNCRGAGRRQWRAASEGRERRAWSCVIAVQAFGAAVSISVGCMKESNCW